MRYLTEKYWSGGKKRDGNVDSLLLLQTLTKRGRVVLAAVCDGMDGHAEGNLASAFITAKIQEWYYSYLLPTICKKQKKWIIRNSFYRLIFHLQVAMEKRRENEKDGMGASLSVLVLWERKYYIWQLGDSAAFGLHKTKSGRRISVSHITDDGKLTKCVGSFGRHRPDFYSGCCRKEDAFLVCSNSFVRKTDNDEVMEILNPGQIFSEEQVRKRLKEIAGCNERQGELDCQTAVYIKIV